jgi:hypothetical protein
MNCFQLRKIGEKEASTLASVDNAICAHFGVAPHPTRYYHFWYDCIGFRLAMGKSLPEIKALFTQYIEEAKTTEAKDGYRHSIEIVDFLAAHYTPDAWSERK